MPKLTICNHVVRFEVFLTSPSEVDIRKTSLHSISVCHPANVAANCKLADDLDIPSAVCVFPLYFPGAKITSLGCIDRIPRDTA